MNTDSYYETGSSHIICEDYALAGQINEHISYAIVCDGCSSSPNTDVGARMVALAAVEFLTGYYYDKDSIEEEGGSLRFQPFLLRLKDAVVFSLQLIKDVLSLEDTCFDSTLLIALSDGKNSHVYMYGDGAYIAEMKNGDLSFVNVNFESNAPYYVSYFMDEKRHQDYKHSFGENKIVKKLTTMKSGGDVEESSEDAKFYYEFLQLDNHHSLYTWCSSVLSCPKRISVVSDGITSYTKSGEKVEPIEMAKKYFAYKNLKGEFVKRRMKRVKKDCEKEDLAHYDDISVATINIEK